MQDQRLGAGSIGLRGRDLSVFQHGVDHKIAPPQGTIGMVDRRVVSRTLGQSRKQRGLRQSELLRRLAEVELRCRLKSEDAMAESNLVGIKSEDLRLGEATLDLDGEHGFLYLALPASIRRQEEIARELHGQRGCAL